MHHNYSGEYENVILRPLEKKDIELLRIWRNNPINSKFLKTIPYITSEMQMKWYDNYLINDNELCFAIEEKENGGKLVGSLSLYDFAGEECYFGKILIGDTRAHGKKIGLNSTIAAIDIAFNYLGIKIIKLFVYEDNKKALTIYKKAGFIVIDSHEDNMGNIEYTMQMRIND